MPIQNKYKAMEKDESKQSAVDEAMEFDEKAKQYISKAPNINNKEYRLDDNNGVKG
eukprot:CAMPEP_0116983108 /NCGR_PEP_ID=MMETSP0467-20121206/60761_1 /TAXON_ID=283647 /ORGANISM="Mesodinium pulex, Strain SPMC105" /LENGTH=55 /DNA_ID=CAMNT_0004677767 /DNA_START=246 /DNA_END=413 /DNA_ORIENTATION=+